MQDFSSPLISVITVVFNGEKTLEATINSVLNSSYPHLEYIVIDGGSTDKTLAIIETYQSKLTYWISEPDRGIYDAMNKGIRVARGDIIGIINSGDLYNYETIQRVVTIYSTNLHFCQYQIINGAMYRFDNEGKIKFKLIKNCTDLQQNIHYGMPLNHPATFITKATYELLGLFDTKYKICADYDFIYRAYHSDRIAFIFTPQILASMSLGGISEQFSSLWIRCREHYQIERQQVFWLVNIARRMMWLMKEILKHLLKQILGKKLISHYYTLRHNH